MKLSDFDFSLDEKFIAKKPVSPRTDAKLLLVPDLKNYHVYDLPEFLQAGDVMVLNNTKVLPVRLYVYNKTGAKIEVMLHKMVTSKKWYAFAKPMKKLAVGEIYDLPEGRHFKIWEKDEEAGVLLEFDMPDYTVFSFLEKYGHVPLPPYIKRDDLHEDKENYQTVYAKYEGAVAAPTAGLHFTQELLNEIVAKGVTIVYVTLHVGAGTFLPVKTENVEEHKMHSEYGYISEEVCDIINNAKRKDKNVLAVGTTSLRLLETAASEDGMLEAFKGETDIFIKPGYKFKSANYLMTNFHLPKSTLFMLVSAYAGLDKMKEAYEFAKAHKYRFYSYGDSSLLKCQNMIDE
jgi:S-adenosylmethionine:tRNA ribosyltransferase-isomerase